MCIPLLIRRLKIFSKIEEHVHPLNYRLKLRHCPPPPPTTQKWPTRSHAEIEKLNPPPIYQSMDVGIGHP